MALFRYSYTATTLTMRNPCYNLYTELDKFIEKLNKRADKKAGRSGQFKKKQRVCSTVSLQEAPEGAPLWTVKVHGSRTQEDIPGSGSTPLGEASVGANARRSISFTADDILSDMDSD